MKKFAAFLAAALLLQQAAVFADYKSEYPWAAASVEYCLENGILKGDETGDLMLGESVTQAQAAVMAVRALNLTDVGDKSLVKKNHWAYDEISKISDYIVLPDTFDADSSASREMFLATVVSAGGLELDEDYSSLKNEFRDCSKIRYEYMPYINAAYLSGILKGDDSGKADPKGTLTRAQAVTILCRGLEATGKITLPDEVKKTETPIVGAPEVTQEQAIKWAKSKGAAQIFTDVCALYWKYGELTGIRADALYAQAAKETAFGKYTGRVTADMNNWAGIKKKGATGDEKDDHESFETPEDGVRGHFNHMCAYVGISPIGVPHGRYFSVKSLSWAGSVKYIEDLGGRWCPDKEYGNQIVQMINEMKGF